MSLSPAAEISTPASIAPAGRPTVTLSRASLALFALAMGSFVIGTSEFASMGVLQLYAADLGLSAPQATAAITAYAIGVVVGAPLVTLVAARANRRLVLLALMALFVVGNLAVYTFIGQLVTEVAGLSSAMIPVALALFGLGMTSGNIVGGALADRRPAWGIALGYAGALAVLAVLAIGGASVWILLPALFGVGAAIMVAIPGIQVRLTSLAPEAPSLMGAMNLAALNVANALGAWLGGMTIAAGYGVLSTAWAGFALTSTGLLVLGVTLMIHRLPKKGI